VPLHITWVRFSIAAGFIGAGLFSGWLFFAHYSGSNPRAAWLPDDCKPF